MPSRVPQVILHMISIGKTINRHDFTIPSGTHTAIFGKTGTGKSTLLERFFADTIQNGNGAALIDFHGSLADNVLGLIPRNRTADVIYFDPLAERIPGINLFDGENVALRAASFVQMVKGIWTGDQILARSEWLLANLSFALMASEQPASILSLQKILSNKEYERSISDQQTDVVLSQFFHTYHSWEKRFREEALSPVKNKIGKLALYEPVRAVLGQATSSFNFRWLMDNRKILICKLPKGKLGADVASLLGSIIVTMMALAALSREDNPDRPPFYLFADEVQNCIHGIDFPTILSEARKYGLFLTIATQTLSQLPDASRAAVFGNCATFVSFRVSGEDAITLAREFSTDLQPSTFQDLPNYSCFAKTMRGRNPTTTYLLDPYAPLVGSEKRRDRIIKSSLLRYGRPKDKVLERINRHLS